MSLGLLELTLLVMILVGIGYVVRAIVRRNRQ